MFDLSLQKCGDKFFVLGDDEVIHCNEIIQVAFYEQRRHVYLYYKKQGVTLCIYSHKGVYNDVQIFMSRLKDYMEDCKCDHIEIVTQ